MSDTAKNWTFDKAPKKMTLLGDKAKKVESAMHIIEFPGDAVEVSRTSDGNYWAHIIVNATGFGHGDGAGLTSANGEVVDTRIDFVDPAIGVCEISPKQPFTQVALLIKPVRR